MQTINTYLPSVTLGAMLLALALVINGQDTLEKQLITQTAVMSQASLVLGEQQKVLQDLGSRTTDQHVRITRLEADLCSWQMARKVQCPE